MAGDVFMRIWFAGNACILTWSCNEDDLLSEDHLDFLIQYISGASQDEKMEICRQFFILKSQYLKIRMNAFVRSMN